MSIPEQIVNSPIERYLACIFEPLIQDNSRDSRNTRTSNVNTAKVLVKFGNSGTPSH